MLLVAVVVLIAFVDVFVDDVIEERATGTALALGVVLALLPPLRVTLRAHAERVLLRAEAIIIGNENWKR